MYEQLSKWNILQKGTQINSEFAQLIHGVEYPCNQFGDSYVKIKKEIFNKPIKDIPQLNTTANLVDVINSFYPYCVKDADGNFIGYEENICISDVIHEDNIVETGEDYVIVKTGIYNRFDRFGNPCIYRTLPTSVTEYSMFLLLVILSYGKVEVGINLFESYSIEIIED